MILREIYELRKENATEELAKKIGWERWVSLPAESAEESSGDDAPAKLVHTTLLLLADIRRHIGKDTLEESYLWNQVDFRAANLRDREYGKTFDRMLFLSARGNYTVISNMTGSGAKHLIFCCGRPTPIRKASNRKTLTEFLTENLL